MVKDNWTVELNASLTETKRLLARLSLKVRSHQLSKMMSIFKPTEADRVLDVGFANDSGDALPDTNFFERFYPFRKQITAASVEDCSLIREKYAPVNIVKIEQDQALPFANDEFEMVTSWATVEHVGDYDQQHFFIRELFRVGKKVFITIPYRGCIYEPHTGFFFLHWLPLRLFRKLCLKFGKTEWAQTRNLNPVYLSDVRKMLAGQDAKVELYLMFGFLPSHILIYSK